MTDERLRRLERRWRQTGGVEDEAAYLLERMRAGQFTAESLRLAAWLQYPAALAAFSEISYMFGVPGTFDVISEERLQAWIHRLLQIGGQEALVRSALSILHLSNPNWRAHFHGRSGIPLAVEWIRDQTERNLHLVMRCLWQCDPMPTHVPRERGRWPGSPSSRDALTYGYIAVNLILAMITDGRPYPTTELPQWHHHLQAITDHYERVDEATDVPQQIGARAAMTTFLHVIRRKGECLRSLVARAHPLVIPWVLNDGDPLLDQLARNEDEPHPAARLGWLA